MTDQNASESDRIETAIIQGPVQPSPLNWPDDCGAEAMFVGRTRIETHPTLGPLVHLEYELYETMAYERMKAIALETVRRWDCRAVRLHHAKGVVEPGQASVVIQVATPHRADAFDACRYMIDRLKHELPIWKVQVWQGGQTHVEGCCAHSEESPDTPARQASSTLDGTGVDILAGTGD